LQALRKNRSDPLDQRRFFAKQKCGRQLTGIDQKADGLDGSRLRHLGAKV
jgi:hypothetical protein